PGQSAGGRARRDTQGSGHAGSCRGARPCRGHADDPGACRSSAHRASRRTNRQAAQCRPRTSPGSRRRGEGDAPPASPMKLVDVNVWLAVSWEGHPHHGIAKRWLDEENDALAFCRVTQMALLRLVSNPAVMQSDVVSRREAWDVFDRLMADPRVRFLDEPDGF